MRLQFVDDLSDVLKKHGGVRVVGVGEFDLRIIRPQKRRSRWTGETFYTKKQVKVHFKPDRELVALVQEYENQISH